MGRHQDMIANEHIKIGSIVLYCIVLYCIDGVVIAAQCTATFSDPLCSPEFRYY